MLQILDPHLRPVPPVPHDATSQKIYKEHMDLAQEYFKVRIIASKLRSLIKNWSSLVVPEIGSLDSPIFSFQNQTEIAYLTKHKKNLLQSMSPEERSHRLDICNKLKEKASRRQRQGSSFH